MNGEHYATTSKDLETIYKLSAAALQRGQIERALRHADHLVRLSGEAAPAIEWAVQLRLQAQLWQEAIDLQRAMTGSPSAYLFSLIGHAHWELGQIEDAERCFSAAIQGNSAQAEWHYRRAAALLQLGRRFEALECLRNGVTVDTNANALLKLAELELEFGDPAEALSIADFSLQFDTSDPSGHTVAAKAMMCMGRDAEADLRWDLAIASGQRTTDVALARANDLVLHGEFERAVALLNALIENDVGLIPAYSLLAAAKRFSNEDRHLIERMESLLDDERLADEDRAALEYGLGKAYDNLKEYETAIRHFDAANRLEYDSIQRLGGFDREGFAAKMAIRRDVFSGEAIQRLRAAGDPSDLPIFVLGMIRSGTTLAEQILSSHTSVAGAGEQEHWLNAEAKLLNPYGHGCDEPTLREQARIYRNLLSRFASEAVRVVDKQPGNLLLAGALHTAFPNARIIHMRRDPLDTAISIWSTKMKTIAPFVHDRANIVFAYREYEKLMAHWREVLPADRFLEVEYEALIADRENETRRMVDFCGLPWDDACLSPETNRRMVATPSLWQVRQPIYRTSVERWKNYEPWLGEFSQLRKGIGEARTLSSGP